jgi:hypothetical protein
MPAKQLFLLLWLLHFWYLLNFMYLVLGFFLIFLNFYFCFICGNLLFERWIKFSFFYFFYHFVLILVSIFHLLALFFHRFYAIDLFFVSFGLLTMIDEYNYYIARIYPFLHLVYFMLLLSLGDQKQACLFFYDVCFLYFFFS